MNKIDSFLAELVTRNKGTFERTFLNKYSKDNLPENDKHLCILEAIEEVKGRNCAVKLDHWKSYKESLGNRSNAHWKALQYFVDKAIEYYEMEVIQYILKEGKYVDSGGPREQKGLKEKGYNIFKNVKKEHRNDSDFFHQNGRWAGHPKWDKIDPILRKELNIEYGSIRSIKDYIRDQEK